MLSFTADQYRQDQVLQILNSEYYSNKDTSIERGIAIADYPVGSNIGELLEQYEQIQKMNDKQAQQQKLTELTSKYSSRNRLFIGRTAKNEAGIFLSGPDGKVKMKFFVNQKEEAKIEITEKDGTVKNIINDKL